MLNEAKNIKNLKSINKPFILFNSSIVDRKRVEKTISYFKRSNLVDNKGKLKERWLKSLVVDIEKLRKKGKEFVIVSSGAIALGQSHLKVKKKGLKFK